MASLFWHERYTLTSLSAFPSFPFLPSPLSPTTPPFFLSPSHVSCYVVTLALSDTNSFPWTSPAILVLLSLSQPVLRSRSSLMSLRLMSRISILYVCFASTDQVLPQPSPNPPPLPPIPSQMYVCMCTDDVTSLSKYIIPPSFCVFFFLTSV
jgi:hypothetical protein